MELTRLQFDILSHIISAKKNIIYNQEKLEQITGYPLTKINNTVTELIDAGYINTNMVISEDGINALEPYRVRRAVFIAAGFGSRLVPVTLNTPKPLIRVKGQRIIDTLIDACLAIDIEEIIIVRGYLAEQFDQLLYKYPMIKFVDNPLYNEANNISSAMCVRNMMKNAYIFEADLFLSNPKILRKYHFNSDVLGIWKKRTDDWRFIEKNGCVDGQTIGGINCYQMVGVFYLNEEDGTKIEEHLKETFKSPGGKEKYWETVATQVYKDQYTIEIIPCTEEDVVEIDTFNELKAIDKTYDI